MSKKSILGIPVISAVWIPFTGMILGILLRLYGLNRSLGGSDENHYLIYFGYLPLKNAATTYFSASNHVLHTLLMRVMMYLFGDEEEWAIRFVSFVAGILCLVLIYKSTQLISKSTQTAYLALFVAALNPTHIFYSQVARGYGLMIFFSTACIFFLLKFFETKRYSLWGTGFCFSGFLSIYTLPTNILFITALAGWSFWILMSQSRENKFLWVNSSKCRAGIILGGVFFIMGFISFAAYSPILDQILRVAQYSETGSIKHVRGLYNLGDNPLTGLVFGLFWKVLELCFKGPLIWFSIFIIAGIILSKTIPLIYRLLPILVVCIPLILVYASGIPGYPRNFLFCWPVLIIFTSVGIVEIFNSLKSGLFYKFGTFGFGVIITSFWLISMVYLLFDYYPKLFNIRNGKLYQKKIRKVTSFRDLILVNNPNNYLYANKIFQYNFNNIVALNQIEDVQVIFERDFDLKDFKIFIGETAYPSFQNITGLKLKVRKLPGSRKIINFADGLPSSIMPFDFDQKALWKKKSGAGDIFHLSNYALEGKSSLLVKGRSKEPFVIETLVVEELIVNQPSLIVLIRFERDLYNLGIQFGSNLLIKREAGNYRGLNMASFNEGIEHRYWDRTPLLHERFWRGRIFIGLLYPGILSAKIYFAVARDKPMLFDSLRLFLVPLSITTKSFKNSYPVGISK